MMSTFSRFLRAPAGGYFYAPAKRSDGFSRGAYPFSMQQCLYFLPLPQGQGSFLPGFLAAAT